MRFAYGQMLARFSTFFLFFAALCDQADLPAQTIMRRGTPVRKRPQSKSENSCCYLTQVFPFATPKSHVSKSVKAHYQELTIKLCLMIINSLMTQVVCWNLSLRNRTGVNISSGHSCYNYCKSHCKHPRNIHLGHLAKLPATLSHPKRLANHLMTIHSSQ